MADKIVNAVIKLEVPEWQIGEPVTVFFKDTMMKKSVCEIEDIVRCKNCKHWDQLMENRGLCNEFTNTHSEALVISGEWFCADGELKEGR